MRCSVSSGRHISRVKREILSSDNEFTIRRPAKTVRIKQEPSDGKVIDITSSPVNQKHRHPVPRKVTTRTVKNWDHDIIEILSSDVEPERSMLPARVTLEMSDDEGACLIL